MFLKYAMSMICDVFKLNIFKIDQWSFNFINILIENTCKGKTYQVK